MPNPQGDVEPARALVASAKHGLLATAHAEMDGWPFGSLVPYALTPELDPILLLSDVAEHTKNLDADSRASLLVADPAAVERPQAGARVTLVGRAAVPGGAGAEAARLAYFARFPGSRAHLSAHGFSPYVLRVEKVRWIAGFGSMGWLERDGWALPPDPLAKHAAGMLAHMNRDHLEALHVLAASRLGKGCGAARMTRIDSKGFDLEVATPGRGEAERVAFAFDAPVTTTEAARVALVAMIAKARGAAG